jgi:membrane-bound lytic murein transglycosylase D
MLHFRQNLLLWLLILVALTFNAIADDTVQILSRGNEDAALLQESRARSIWTHIQTDIFGTQAQKPAVASQLHTYQKNNVQLQRSLLRSEPYLYHIVTELEKRHLPLAFALLPLIESAYDPKALSQKGAAGLWQLMPGTARAYGVTQNGFYDGRKDLLASTEAALEHLSHLSELFNNDWLLVLAAYNAGEGTVQRAIRRNEQAKLPTDFWSLRLPRQTQLYVPKLLALAELVSQADHYGLKLPQTPKTPIIEYVELESQIDLAMAARLAGISLAELYKLNPGFKQRKTNPNGPHRIFLPSDHVDVFQANLSHLPPTVRASWNPVYQDVGARRL